MSRAETGKVIGKETRRDSLIQSRGVEAVGGEEGSVVKKSDSPESARGKSGCDERCISGRQIVLWIV